MTTKVEEIAARLAKLDPEAQAEELAKIERNLTKKEAKAQASVLEEHKVGVASAVVDMTQAYCREHKVDIKTILPLTISVTETDKGIVGEVKGRGKKGGGGGGTRAKSFLKQKNVESIELKGEPITKPTESEVLRLAHGAKTAAEVYKGASPHVVAAKPENQKLIRDMGFVAVLADGSKVPLADLYNES